MTLMFWSRVGKFPANMKRHTLFLFTLFFFVTAGLDAYIWPTNAPQLLSGTFGERRAGHFHSGIDIKTWARPGYDCYAVGDGYIARVSEHPNGYGKVLYLKLDNGQTAVYAHLLKFTGKLEMTVYSLKERNKTNIVDKSFAPNEIRVREGTLIAYSGGSGTQYPHLHFELRDRQDRPLNPLKNGFDVEDKVAPKPLQLALTPADIQSEVQGENTYGVFPLEYFRNDIYVCRDTIQAKGRILVSLQAYDQSASGNSNGVYQSVLYYQGKKKFVKQFDKFSFDETGLIVLDRDYRLADHGFGDFHALYSKDANRTFSAYDSTLNGVIDVLPGYQTLVIQLRDTHGNRSSVKFVVYGGAYPQARFATDLSDNFFTIVCDSLIRNHSAREFILDKYNPYGYLTDRKILLPQDLQNGRLVMSRRETSNSVMTLQVRDSLNFLSEPQFFYFNQTTQPAEGKLSLRSHQFGDRILFELYSDRPLSHELLLAVEKKGYESLPLHRRSMFSAMSDPIPLKAMSDLRSISVYEEGNLEWVYKMDITALFAARDEKREWMSADSSLALIIPRNCFYSDAVVWFKPFTYKDEIPGGKLLSSVWQFYPEDIPTRRGLSLAFRFKDSFPLSQKMGIYSLDTEKGLWKPLAVGAVEPERPYIDVKGVGGGILAVLEDIQAPEILNSMPGNGGTYRARDLKQIWAEIGDNLSGFGNGQGIKIHIDGAWKVFYYNSVTKVVTIDDPGLKPGIHSMEWELTDVAGNVMTKKFRFRIIQ